MYTVYCNVCFVKRKTDYVLNVCFIYRIDLCFYRHQLDLEQLILISTNWSQNDFLNTDKLLLSFLLAPPPCLHVFTVYSLCHFVLLHRTSFMFSCLCMCGLLDCYRHLVMAPLEIYLLRKMLTSSNTCCPCCITF